MSVFNCARCGVSVDRHGKGAKLCWPCTDRHKTKPLATEATKLVSQAKRDGLIPPASDLICVDCGKPACDYDHRDYTKPLDIEPVCRSCNCLRGPAYPYLEVYR